ncbi:MAG: cold shock domain-containing protein [Bacteroidetes bacterium]|nr:cold shock domain-containing protein [Bacteroidota bacterium]
MARSQQTSRKKEVRTKQDKKKKEKEKKRLEKKENKDGSSADDMIAYVDEFGNISSTPPDLSRRTKVNAEDIAVNVARDTGSGTAVTFRKGVVAFFNDDKGYGFIKDSENGRTVFVHINGLTEPIKQDNLVTFEVENGPKGAFAVNVKLNR